MVFKFNLSNTSKKSKGKESGGIKVFKVCLKKIQGEVNSFYLKIFVIFSIFYQSTNRRLTLININVETFEWHSLILMQKQSKAPKLTFFHASFLALLFTENVKVILLTLVIKIVIRYFGGAMLEIRYSTVHYSSVDQKTALVPKRVEV